MKVSLCLAALWLLCATPLFAQSPKTAVPQYPLRSEAQHAISAAESSNALEFVPNMGQLSDKRGNEVPQVLYATHAHGLTVYFEKDQLHFYFSRVIRNADPPRSRLMAFTPHDPRGDTMICYRVDLGFVGANPSPEVVPGESLQDYSNYYIPRFPNGLTDVPTYGSLLYRELYPNIDLRLYSTEHGMKYDFIVHPGGDPSRIRMRYSGADSLVEKSGSIQVLTPFGLLEEQAPVTYQPPFSGDIGSSPSINGQSTQIASRYSVEGHDVRFSVGEYDHSRTLVIDPPRVWGTYFGGSSYDVLFGNATDRSENILVTGECLSPGFGTAGTYQDTLNSTSGYPVDAIVLKFAPSGARLWSTYFGGGLSYGFGLTIDAGNNVVIAGETWDDTCVASPGAFQTKLNNQVGNHAWDGFIAKFDSLGHRNWSTYFGTSDTDIVYDIASDSSSNILFVGYTSSTSGIASSGAFKTSRTRTAMNDYGGFLAKFSPSGSRLWSTYIGDTVTECLGVCRSPGDSIVVSGLTICKAGITTTGVYQNTLGNYVAGILMKFSPSGLRSWGTYVDGTLGSGYGTELYRVACGPGGVIYTGGVTWTPTGLGTTGAYRTSMIYGHEASLLEKFDGSGNRLIGTYIGDSYRYEVAFNIAIGPDGAPVVAGWTTDSMHIATVGAFNTAVNDTDVSYLMKFGKDLTRKWGTYFEGNEHPGRFWDQIYGLTIDRHAHPIFSGVTSSDSGIATIGSFQTSFGGNEDGFLEKFCDTLLTPLQSSGDSVMCFGSADTIAATSGYTSYQWRQSGTPIPGATLNKYGIPKTQAPGTYHYTVDIADPRICVSKTDTLNLTIRSLPAISAGPDQSVCLNSGVQIGNTATAGLGPYHYNWLPDTGLSSASIAMPVASPKLDLPHFHRHFPCPRLAVFVFASKASGVSYPSAECNRWRL